MAQTSIFDYLYETYKINKPIRLIEMFAGYGSQHLALNYLGYNVESYKIIEWAVPSIQAYKDLHYTNKNDDYTENMTLEELVIKLVQYGISSNYNEPMSMEQIKRKGLVWCKQVYNNIKNTNNLVNIMNVKGKDLEIKETNKYEYIMTYSFPCQDLSLGGKRMGMDEDSGTRSSMLWQVKRILDELKELGTLPNVLLMENVPQVMAKDNLQNMEKWDEFLSSLGYKSYIKNLIATDYGIPQIRNRTFMISILGNCAYTFPRKEPLELKLSDLLEKQVDEKYFLSDKVIDGFMTVPKSGYPRDERFMTSLNSVNQNDVANTIKTKEGTRPTDNFIVSKGIATNESKEWQKEPLEEISRTLLSNKANCGVGVLLENKKTKKYRNYVSWEDEKGRINTQDHRAYDGDVVGTISAMERGIPNILIPEATAKGYVVAEEGDGVYINRPQQKRGVVQKGKIQTIKTQCDDIGVVVDARTEKEKLCDELLELPQIKKGDVVKHSFTTQIKDGNKKAIEMSEIMPTLITRTDTLGVVVEDDNLNKLRIRKITPLEAFRLMGVKDEDYYKIAANQSNSSLYHLAGDSIVVNVLMAIFKQLLEGEN